MHKMIKKWRIRACNFFEVYSIHTECRNIFDNEQNI